MQNYSEWFNNKMYQGHIQRLGRIKQRNNLLIKSQKKFRIKTEPSRSSSSTKKKQFLPLPLVSKHQRSLLSGVLQGRCINLKQKQQLLENYLLSKRILQTNSVFDSKLLKKQYRFHKKVSQNMNRNQQLNRKTFSQLRTKKFSELQSLKQNQYLGTGKKLFSIKINQIIMIKRKLEDNNNSTFNLIFKPQKLKSYHLNSLTFTQLINKTFHFRMSQKQLKNKNGIKILIQQIRGNQVHKLAFFNILLEDQMFDSFQQIQSNKTILENPQINNSEIVLEKQKERKKNIISTLYHPVSKCLIGSIKLQYTVKNYI